MPTPFPRMSTPKPGPANAISRRDVRDRSRGRLGAAVLAGTPALAQQARVKLRLMETTDLHVNVLPYDYYRDKPDDTVGLARTATLIAAARAEAKNACCSTMATSSRATRWAISSPTSNGMKAGEVHPVFLGMNTLDYACATLGNHEFNYGLTFLGFALAGAKFPFVCANLVKADGDAAVKPWIVLDKRDRGRSRGQAAAARRRHRLRAAADHAVGPGPSRRQGVARDIVDAAQRHVPELRAAVRRGVALCHSGIDASRARAARERRAAISRSARHRRDLHGSPA